MYFVESDDNQPNRKRSRETAYQRHGTANRGTVQSIRADGRYYFGDYPIDVASKTGTPQATGSDDNATFIAYAPANDPEIAVAVVVEKGYSGQRGAPVAKAIFDEYFGLNDQQTEQQSSDGQLIP